MLSLDDLEGMWASTVRRSRELLVPNVCHEARSLHNEHWAFDVGYAFRDALDIRLTDSTRTVIDSATGIKRKVVERVWTQGVIINFREGDALYSRDGMWVLQVMDMSAPMGWDPQLQTMYKGAVRVTAFRRSGGSVPEMYEDLGVARYPQMHFLKILINGFSPELLHELTTK
ncbi:MAG: hypothetical protein ACRBBW_03915 [Cellvibrionaceae bacterium]